MHFQTLVFLEIGCQNFTDMVAPEFQITNSVTILGYANELHDWIFRSNQAMEYHSFFSGETATSAKRVNFDFTDELALEELSEVGELIERLNILLVHGQLTDETRAIIRDTIEQIPDNRAEYRVRIAIFLTMLSPDYLIFR